MAGQQVPAIFFLYGQWRDGCGMKHTRLRSGRFAGIGYCKEERSQSEWFRVWQSVVNVTGDDTMATLVATCEKMTDYRLQLT